MDETNPPRGARVRARLAYQRRVVRAWIRRAPAAQSLPLWISALITGLVAVGYASLFKLVSQTAQRLATEHAIIFAACAPALFLIGWALVHWLAPDAGGSGIPQVMAANELDHHKESARVHSLLGLKTAVVKILSSLFCLAGGGAIGREGPTIQIAASIFHEIGKRSERIWPRINHSALIVAGGAAGIASAFNTPLGGIVYAIEELSTRHFARLRSGLVLAVIASGLVSQWILGTYLYLGFPKLGAVNFDVLPYAILVGVITGLIGASFGKLLYGIMRWRRKLKSPARLAAVALGCGALMAVIGLAIGPFATGSGIELIHELLFREGAGSQWSWSIGRFVASLVSYASGCAGGIFAPSLALGASIGSQLAHLVSPLQANLMVLLGMIGLLTGVTRTPLTAFVLVVEMTDRHSAIFPMMLTAMTAYGAARLIDRHSFYEHMKEAILSPAPQTGR